MKVRVILASDNGKILVNGEERKHMVSLFGVDGELPDITDWVEEDET